MASIFYGIGMVWLIGAIIGLGAMFLMSHVIEDEDSTGPRCGHDGGKL